MKTELNSITINYEVCGSGKPLILLHGNGESHKIFNKAIEALKDQYRIFTPDSRGHGKSTRHCEITYDLLASDIIAFIKKLSIEKPVLYGFSDGGITALLVAMKEPDLLASAIISGANIFPEGLNEKTLKAIQRSYFFTRRKLDKLMLTEPSINPADLEKITIPVHVLAGEYDLVRREHTELIAKHIKNSTLEIIESEDHGSYIVHSSRLAPVLLKYLQSSI